MIRVKQGEYKVRMTNMSPYGGRDYDFTVFKKADVFPIEPIEEPFWIAEQEAGRRKKTIYVNCPSEHCLKINKLDRRAVLDTGVFSRPGCFYCRGCRMVLRPFLENWDPNVRRIKKPTRRLKVPAVGPVDVPLSGTIAKA